jgi:inositol phosphorylceramide synthase catalytic subunit
MKAFPNYLFNGVSIEGLYELEKSFFGISLGTDILTPNEYLNITANTFLDIVSGLFYLMWIPVPLLFAAWLFFKSKKQFLYFSLTFLLVNLLGFIVYYLYPAAPPWYVQINGFDFQAHTPGNAAGLTRFDQYVGKPIFQSLYSKSSNVFAAMPSLHASYPLIVLYYGVKIKLKQANILFTVVMLGIWFAAIYSGHHYVLDIIAGIICAIIGIWLFNWLKGTRVIAEWIDRWMTVIV